MKKWFAIGVAMLSMMVVLVGCAPERMQYDISGASRVEIAYSGKRVAVTDPEDVQYLTDEINAMVLRRGESSKETYYGTGYGWLSFYDAEGNLMKHLTFATKDTIENGYGYFYRITNEMDPDFFDELEEMIETGTLMTGATSIVAGVILEYDEND